MDSYHHNHPFRLHLYLYFPRLLPSESGASLTLALIVCIALEVIWAMAISDLESAYAGNNSGSGYGYGYTYGYAMVKRQVASYYNGETTLGGLHFTTFAVPTLPSCGKC